MTTLLIFLCVLAVMAIVWWIASLIRRSRNPEMWGCVLSAVLSAAFITIMIECGIEQQKSHDVWADSVRAKKGNCNVDISSNK